MKLVYRFCISNLKLISLFFHSPKNFTDLTSPQQPPNFLATPDSKKGILKSKSGCIGLFPTDLSSELKNRLKKSTHASVTNLKRTTSNIITDRSHLPPPVPVQQKQIESEQIESSSDSEDGISPGKNLAKILRSVSKENMYKTTKTPPSGLENDDAKCLVKNLICMEKGTLVVPQSSDDLKTSTSEGESSGGREINTIIKNSAVARKKRLNDG